MIDRDEYLADQRALLACLEKLFKALEPIVEAGSTHDEVALGAKILRATDNLEDARKALAMLSLRPSMSELLESLTEDEMAVLREKLGLVDDEEEDDE